MKIKAKVFHFKPGDQAIIAGTAYKADEKGAIRRHVPKGSAESYERAMRTRLQRLGCQPSKFKVKQSMVDGGTPTVSYGKALDCVDFLKFAMMIESLPDRCGIARVLAEGAKL